MKLLAFSLVLSALAVGQTQSVPSVYSTTGVIASSTLPLPKIAAGSYTLLLSIDPPGPEARLLVEVLEGNRVYVAKTLHAGDADLYAPLNFAAGAPNVSLRLTAQGNFGGAPAYHLQVNRWEASPQLRAGANHTWETASGIALGTTVFASNDEMEYIPVPGTRRKETAQAAESTDWYRVKFDSPRPKLVFFQIDLMDRDDLPVDVSVFRVKDGQLVEYTKGQDPVAVAHEVQALPGNKFSPRVLVDSGDYYVRVRASHPEYKLRTRVYDVPPYSDPQQAVQTGIDYIMGAGDSWFANTPRRGGTLDRVSSVHQETSLCVGCHTSHFSQRAQLMATANGYPVVQRQQLHFLEERFYQNPRPFYGFEKDGAVWARVISAPANVLSRMSILTGLYENNVSQQPRPKYHEGINDYLKLYFAGRDKLPADETNGNTPLVSGFEVAWYSWKSAPGVVNPEIIANGEVKNMIDLCYQTLALADIDRVKYKDKIAANAERLLSLQRPDGQWSMRFDPKEAEVEFQTGHVLWALSAAGVPVTNPQVKKSIDYVLSRQQDFGGWMDPLQSFENFRTPFRETQYIAIALSSYFPKAARAPGWNAATVTTLPADPAKLLTELDNVWDAQTPEARKQIESATQSNEVLIRQAAAEALGRLAQPDSVPVLTKLLGDPSKLVQRAAAWSLRQVYDVHPERDTREILTAMDSQSARVRWGATRIFAHQFQPLAVRNELVAALARRTNDPVLAVRMQAVRGLWQSWFWNASDDARNQIEDTLLADLKVPQHPWIENNLSAAIYNLADENIRYLYNNWVTLMPRAEDRDRAVEGRLAVEARLSKKFIAVLKDGPDTQKKELLAALTDLPQRRADIYDLESEMDKPGPTVYNRIGNDIEQIAFFGSSADAFALALQPLMDSKDPVMARLANKAVLLVRETPYARAEELAGGRGENAEAAGARLQGELAAAFRPRGPGGARGGAAAPVKSSVKLDEKYFHAYIEPILNKKGPDGYACAGCHVTHTMFNATWSTVKNVVDTANPENSLLLRKPTSTAESEGVAGSKTLAHGGGRRFEKGSPEYETIKKWIEGASVQP